MRQGASVVREVTCIEYLDACMLLTIKWCDDWLRLTGFAAQIEGHLWVIEPQAQVILVGWWERDTTVITKGKRESLHVEDAFYSNTTCANAVCFQVALIPCHAKWLVWQFENKEVIACIGRQARNADRHGLV